MYAENGIAGIRARLAELRADGARVALVPTMGALHAGHLALVDAARAAADVVVVSIFVNPLQFGPSEDFARYPRALESDSSRLAERGTSVLFAPSVSEMYGDGSRTTVTPRAFADTFEGAVRPGHFAGVLTVVAKLFNIVQPNVAVFGRKDLQQLAAIRAMAADLNFPIDIRAVDTVRERDGLALSSRNFYLDERSRRRAARIRAALVAARAAFEGGVKTADDLEAAGRTVLAQDGALDVDYFSVVRESDFERPGVASSGDSVVAAVRVGGTRLIDNIQL
jgi:pantoate--beta-alanine ligase